MLSPDLEAISNRGENKFFLKTALAWKGSVTPKVLPRILVTLAYAALIVVLRSLYPELSLSITPFEYSGAVLTLLLVSRVNAGVERWWEARKIWGSIVNQSRNLAIIGYEYTPRGEMIKRQYLNWVASWPHVMRESLRNESRLLEVETLLGNEEAQRIRTSQHMPTYVATRIAQLLVQMRKEGMDDFSFQRAERERALLIDAIGACERIRNTPIPYVLAIKIRRFILLFILLLPFALIPRLGVLTPLVVFLVSYPLFSLDEIGAELQNPFSPRNLSHLPLTKICQTIESNVLAVDKQTKE